MRNERRTPGSVRGARRRLRESGAPRRAPTLRDPSPSTEDLTLTTAVAAAAAVVGMPLVDHVIVTRAGGYVSLRDIGALDAV